MIFYLKVPKINPPMKCMAVLYLSVDCGGSQTKIGVFRIEYASVADDTV